MKNLLIIANSWEFLISYKTHFSNTAIDAGFNVIWMAPSTPPESLLIPGITFKSVKSKRFGILSIINYICAIIRNSDSQTILVSHTVYCNLSLFFARLISPRSFHTCNLVLTGLGPVGIRRGIRIRVLKKIYQLFLRISITLPDVKVLVLNHFDKAFIQDFSNNTSSLFLVRESGIHSSDYIKGDKSNKSSLEYLSSYDNPLRIGYIGRLLYEKGIDHIISTQEMCFNLGISNKFNIAGTLDVSNSSSLSQVDMLKLYDNFIIHSDIHYSEFFELIDVLIFPSMREGHPKYLLQAMAYGVIPIVYPNPGLDVDVIHGFNGLIARMSSPSSLTSCLYSLHTDREKLFLLKKGANSYSKLVSQSVVDNKFLQVLTGD